MKRLLPILAFFYALDLSMAADVLFLSTGDKRPGNILSVTPNQFSLEVPLPPQPGSSLPPPVATVGIPRPIVLRIEFDETEPLSAFLAKSPSPSKIEELWKKWEPFLGIPKSPAGNIALAYGDVLLRSPETASAALELFQRIEKQAWDEASRESAKQGRLRAMIATGNAAAAVDEAKALAQISEDPAVLIEAKFILASAAESSLRKLLEDNPRWQEDIYVIPERNRLHYEALDQFLYPYLFLGSESEAAARGLWGAIGVYRLAGEESLALEAARDLLALYPQTPQAAHAQSFIDSLPESIRSLDAERDAREDLSPQTKNNEKS